MEYSRNDLKKFIKGILSEKKETFLLHENEGPCWASIMDSLANLQREDPQAFKNLITSLSNAYAQYVGSYTPECEPAHGSAASLLWGKQGQRDRAQFANLASRLPGGKNISMTPKKPRVTKTMEENYDYPEGGKTVRGEPHYLPGEEPINVGKNVVADDDAGKILSTIDAVIEMDVEDYQSQGYDYEEALQLAREDAAQTLEIVLNDLDNN